MLLCVFANRAIGREDRREPRHALTHHRDPLRGDALLVALVELRDDFTLQQRVQSLRFGGVHIRIVAVLLAIADRPAHFR